MALTKDDLKKIIAAAIKMAEKNGASYYNWQEPAIFHPGTENWTQKRGWGKNVKNVIVGHQEVEQIFNAKLDGAYGERLMMTLGLLVPLIDNGYNLRLVQFQEEVGVPFDANGWLALIVETMPVFHWSPGNLDASDLGSIVELLEDNEAPDVSWKNTNKVGEFHALMRGSLEPGLDLLKIAQEYSANK